jgi:hypothetical protein
MADNGDGGCTFAIIFGGKEATGKGLYADDGEVIARDEADVERLSRGVVLATSTNGSGASLHGDEAVDAWSLVAKGAVEVIGEDAPVTLEATVDTALDLLADLV